MRSTDLRGRRAERVAEAAVPTKAAKAAGGRSLPHVGSADHNGGTATLTCRGLRVALRGSEGLFDVLSGVDLTVASGEFVSVLGASGAGKTTLLRVLAGLERHADGDVLFGQAPIQGPPAGVVTVFQDYSQSLLPWRTVERNAMLGIESRLSKREAREQARESLAMVGLADYAKSYPWQLSGGMQQRLQIARALAMRPRVLLMDEPFGALDAMTKASLQDQLQELHTVTGATVVFVTHDVEEAVYLSDRVVVLTGRPASVGLVLTIDLPRPREQVTTRESAEYLALRHQVYAALGVGGGH